MAYRWGNNGNSDRVYFLGLQNHCGQWLQPWNEETLAPWKKSYDQPRQHIKKQRHYFAYKDSYSISSSHVWMWKLDHQEGWAPKNWCLQTAMLEKTFESPLDCKEIKLVNPKGNQPWIFLGRTDAEGEAPILWPPDAKSQLNRKDPKTGKDWRQEKRATEDVWRASVTWWTWVWANSGQLWRTGKPGVLQFIGSQRIRQDCATEQEQIDHEKKLHSLLQ